MQKLFKHFKGASLTQLAADSNSSVCIYEQADSHSISLKKPLFYEPTSPDLDWLHDNERTTFPYQLQYQIENKYIACMGNATIISDFFISVGDKIAYESYHSEYLFKKVLHAHSHFSFTADDMADGTVGLQNNVVPTFFDKPCIIIGSRCATNYWHWITEIIPRFWFLRENPFFRDCYIIIPKITHKFQRETLTLLNLREDRLLQLDTPANVTFKNAIFPSMISPCGYSYTIKDFYVPLLANRFPMSNTRRIYVSRKLANRRHVVNEEQLYSQLLRNHGFEIVCLEDLSFFDQVRLFSQAEVVIAACGSGLTNIIFANQSLKIVEILHDRLFAKYIWLLSNALNQKYTFYMADRVDNGSEASNHNYYINLRSFEKLLELVIAT